MHGKGMLALAAAALHAPRRPPDGRRRPTSPRTSGSGGTTSPSAAQEASAVTYDGHRLAVRRRRRGTSVVQVSKTGQLIDTMELRRASTTPRASPSWAAASSRWPRSVSAASTASRTSGAGRRPGPGASSSARRSATRASRASAPIRRRLRAVKDSSRSASSRRRSTGRRAPPPTARRRRRTRPTSSTRRSPASPTSPTSSRRRRAAPAQPGVGADRQPHARGHDLERADDRPVEGHEGVTMDSAGRIYVVNEAGAHGHAAAVGLRAVDTPTAPTRSR